MWSLIPFIWKFQNILKEIDEDFSEEELDGIIADVRVFPAQ